MARIVLITTGVMEAAAFHTSLARIFPDHEFTAWTRLDGFTSATLPPKYEELRDKQLLRLNEFANTLIGRLNGGRRDDPQADFVIGIEDMELRNASAPANITLSLRDAVAENLEHWGDASKRQRLAEALRTRCSFHLMAPMTEAYFFADSAALARATAPTPDQACRFDARACDVETFNVEDPAYLNAPVISKAERKRNRHDWRCGDRQGHPKRYIEYLTDPNLDGKARYTETTHGCDALAQLDWPRIVRRDASAEAVVARFARSLLADLVDMLGPSPAYPELDTLEPSDCHSLTWPPPRGSILRNL